MCFISPHLSVQFHGKQFEASIIMLDVYVGKNGSENNRDLEAQQQHKVVCGNELPNIQSHNSSASA